MGLWKAATCQSPSRLAGTRRLSSWWGGRAVPSDDAMGRGRAAFNIDHYSFVAAFASGAVVALSGWMEPTALELATRFVAALYFATKGRPAVFRGIGDCATRAGIRGARDIDLAVHAAEAAGFIAVHDDEPLVMLTAKGREAARSR
jgi:hypothetical protein